MTFQDIVLAVGEVMALLMLLIMCVGIGVVTWGLYEVIAEGLRKK